MKIQITAKTFFLFLCLLIFNLAIFAQEKPRAIKFDEFDDVIANQFYSERDELTFSQRVKRFSKQLEKEHGIKVYVIYYQARIVYENFGWNFVNRANDIKNQIMYDDRIKAEDVVIVDGGYREKNTIEFWIVPKNADPPKPTPEFDKSETFLCPRISVYSPVPSFDDAKIVGFSVSTDNLKSIKNYSLTWKVSAGEIAEGQGTKAITVKLNDSGIKRVTAFVEVGGLPYPCGKVGFATIEVGRKAYLIEKMVGYNYSYLSALVDSFMVELNNNPTLKGYIIVYANRSTGTKEMERSIASVKRIFAFRKYDPSRATIIRGGYREDNTVDLWIAPEGTEPPKPTPTVDEKFIAPANKSSKKKTRRRN
ncbi:MAG: hypothetical protein ACR2HG_07420 [Pyrinomonadaceae bacterium]